MGLLQLSEMRGEVDSSLGNRTNVSDARIDLWINQAYHDVASGLDFEDLDEDFAVATVAADHDYAGPTNPLVIKLVRDDTSDNLLTWIPKEEFFRLTRATTDTPKRWTRHKADILLWPTPDAVYNLNVIYKKTPTKLSLDGDTTVIPAWSDTAIILLAAHYGLLAVGEDQRSTVWFNRALAYLQSRLTEEDFARISGGMEPSQPNLVQEG